METTRQDLLTLCLCQVFAEAEEDAMQVEEYQAQIEAADIHNIKGSCMGEATQIYFRLEKEGFLK